MFHDSLAVKAALLHKFSEQRVLVVGDMMLDRYLWGSATRISPEAPVPVVRVKRRSVALGGASNVARNLISLKVPVEVAGFLGFDTDADEFRLECASFGIGTSATVQIEEFCTVTKTRVIADDRQLLRFDDEISAPRSDAEVDLLLNAIESALAASSFTAVILSDYAKGVCTPYFCQKLIQLCVSKGLPVYVDPKGKDYRKYAGATAIKPNRVEMIELAEAEGWTSVDVVESAAKLRELLNLEFVALTLGSQGIAVVQRDGLHQIATQAREVFDVSGAGDTVMATMVAGISSGLPLEDSVALANIAAAEVIAHTGTCAVGREDLLVAIQAHDRAHGVRKLYTTSELSILVNAWRAQGLKVAFTNGCFDLLHAGHVRLLEDSAALCDRLIIGINSDASITRLKGPKRPLMPMEQRAGVLSALECIDAVVVFEEDTPQLVIEGICPDILIKGGDYTVETVVGADYVIAHGGEVKLVPLVKGISTSYLADAINKL
ncbi:D-glycero-beta-D-manno-heptose-7-phosphate kinase [soil metagenome]